MDNLSAVALLGESSCRFKMVAVFHKFGKFTSNMMNTRPYLCCERSTIGQLEGSDVGQLDAGGDVGQLDGGATWDSLTAAA